ncbi:oxidoreductase [Paenibacillus cymbidii]|uniref:oxidoreductase n=1 Tax=Paenibacillus cymbidii TaxID=1639034 RepID=UPI002E2662C4
MDQNESARGMVFPAWVHRETNDGSDAGLTTLAEDALPAGDVLVRVAYSSINYKDALALTPGGGGVLRKLPMVPGIDLSGVVARSGDPRFREGDRVLATGYDLGTAHYGGFAAYCRLPADWLVPLPDGLSLREAMGIGTAGFTAALAIERLEQAGLRPDSGDVLVTGATGGVGSFAVALLAERGYTVVAMSGKPAAHPYLRQLGAARIVGRAEPAADGGAKRKPLERQLWAGAVDSVGGGTLAGILAATKYGGSVAACGLAGGAELQTTVLPFILRGVNLLGIDSVYCPKAVRERLWGKLGGEWKPQRLGAIVSGEVPLAEAADASARLLQGEATGRTVVRVGGDAE